MKTTPGNNYSFPGITGAVFLLLLLPFNAAQAGQTSYISPDAVGTYTGWINGADFSLVSNAVGCVDGDTGAWGTFNPIRNTATIPLGASLIPDGATIDSVDVQVCQAYFLVAGATFQTIIRLDGSDIDSGVDVPTAGILTASTQNIPIPGGLLYSAGSTTLEAGGLLTSGSGSQNVIFTTLAARINYRAPTTTTVTCEPIVEIGEASACTATVTPGEGGPPTATVTWSSDNSGSFSSESCTPNGTDQVCTAEYTPDAIGTHVLTATYPDDPPDFTGGAGIFTLQATEPAPVPALGPLGLFLTMLGAGLLGLRQLRRRS